jgi:hypothetical protein
MNIEMNEVVQVLMGLGAIVLLVLLGFLVTLLVRLIRKLEETYLTLDHALAGFGQTGIGRLAHQAATEGRTYVDEPTDAMVIRLAQILNSVAFIAKVAHASNVEITPERVALWGRAFFDALGGLTDGVPAEGVPIPQRESFEGPGEGPAR